MKNPLFFLFVFLMATFSWQGTAQTYCASEGNTTYENITNVTFAGINNTTTTHPGYNDFTSQLASVVAGGTNQMSVTIKSDGDDYIFAFIDWNQNGVLDDAGEVYTIAFGTSSIGPHTTPIAIPGDALSGNTRMRVLVIWNQPTPNPCGYFNYGEVEDYTVSVTGASCSAPSNMAAAAITSSTADIIWRENGTATEWDVVYGLAGFDPLTEGSTITDSDGTPGITLTGLAHSSNYSFYVKAICDLGDESFLAGPIVFSTQCSLAAAPWSENFDSGTLGAIITNDFICWNQEYVTTPPLDWELINTNGDGSIVPHSGSLMAGLSNEDVGETTKLITPALDLTALNAPQLTFYFANADWGGDLDELRVYYKRSVSDLNWTLISGAEYTTPHTDWEEVILLLPDAIGATDYVIAFEGTANYGYGVSLDDISVEEAPTCLRPSALAVTYITDTTADISWTPEGVGTSWIVSWGAPGYDPEVGNIGTDISTVATYQIIGLSTATDYDIYIKTDCGEGDISRWAGPKRFKTACGPIDYMYEDFDSYSTGEIVPDCWDRMVPDNAGIQLIIDFDPASAPNNMLLATELVRNPIIVVLPIFDNITDGTHWLRFKAKQYIGANAPPAVLKVGYVTDINDYASFTLLEDITITNENYSLASERSVIVPNTVPANARLAFTNSSDNITYFFDDVYWETTPTCFKPKDLIIIGKSQTTLDIEWIEGASETDWNISWGTPGYTPGDGDEIGIDTTTTTSYQVTGLDLNSSYDIYVKSVCGIGDESIWLGPLSARTECGVATIPFLESFEDGFQDQTPIAGCWTQESIAGTEVWMANMLSDFNRTPRTGNFNASLNSNNTDWLFYPVQLDAGTNYQLKFYARQYNTTGATIEAAFGTANNAAAMTTSIIAPSNVINGNYQAFSGTFTPDTAGTYYFGIKATSDYNPQYISIDDISVDVYQPDPSYFVTTWTTTTANESITIPTRSFQNYSYSVDWEYNGVWESGFTGAATHTYATPGTYTVAIRGDFPKIFFDGTGDKEKIQSIEQWGTIVWKSMGKSFKGCSNLVYNATDTPDLSSVSDMTSMFEGASSFNGDLSSWNVSNVQGMKNMFSEASIFNGVISTWDVSNVTGMSQMFSYASAFNEDIGSWNVGNVENMSGMFDAALIFNQDIIDWNVSNVADMSYMFNMASAFNQDIGSWNVGNVDNMTSMFQDASSFNQNLGDWDVSNVTNMEDMLNGAALSIDNYDLLLNGWHYLPLQNGVIFSAGTSQYCSGQASRDSMIADFGWTITDGGLNCAPCLGVTEYTIPDGWSNGAPDNTLVAVFSDDYDTTLGSIDACSIEIRSGATLTVSEGTTIKAENNIVINGDLIFLSSAAGNGELAAMGPISTIIGDATVQRYTSDHRAYRMVSPAVTTTTSINANWQEGVHNIGTTYGDNQNPNPGFGTHITGSQTGANGFDATLTGNASMFTVNVATQQFEIIGNTNTKTLTAGEGYLMHVRGDRGINLTDNSAHSETVLRTTGALATGTQIQNFASQDAGDFVMFGNPYQSAVDINSVFANSTNLNTNFYYVYDPTLAANGAYVTVTLPEGTSTSGEANQFLQPGQGGQVATLAAGASSVVFNESDKAPGNHTATNRPTSGNDMLTVLLYTTENFNNGGPVHDSFGMLFAENNDNNLTPADAVKPMNFYENLGINHEGTYLSIERRAMPQAVEVFHLYSTGYSQTDYTLKLTIDGFEESFFYLDDTFMGTSTLLEAGINTYSFDIDANEPLSKATDRFSIRTEQRLSINDNNLLAGIRLYPNPVNGEIFYINAPRLNGAQLIVSISDLTGRNIYEQTLECIANTITIPMSNDVASGVYMVTLKYSGETNTFRLIKE